MLAKVRRHLGRLGRLLRRPLADQWLVVQAFFLLGHSRLRIRRHGLAGVEDLLGERMGESPDEISPEAAAAAERIGWAVTSVSIYTPWTSNCFPQALAAQQLLASSDIGATVYFGATRDTANTDAPTGAPMAGHAWVRAGDRIITGGDVHKQYTPIVWFTTHTCSETKLHHGEP